MIYNLVDHYGDDDYWPTYDNNLSIVYGGSNSTCSTEEHKSVVNIITALIQSEAVMCLKTVFQLPLNNKSQRSRHKKIRPRYIHALFFVTSTNQKQELVEK